MNPRLLIVIAHLYRAGIAFVSRTQSDTPGWLRTSLERLRYIAIITVAVKVVQTISQNCIPGSDETEFDTGEGV
jgi:hypothetical protein